MSDEAKRLIKEQSDLMGESVQKLVPDQTSSAAQGLLELSNTGKKYLKFILTDYFNATVISYWVYKNVILKSHYAHLSVNDEYKGKSVTFCHTCYPLPIRRGILFWRCPSIRPSVRFSFPH
jgi:hypothetical protein